MNKKKNNNNNNDNLPPPPTLPKKKQYVDKQTKNQKVIKVLLKKGVKALTLICFNRSFR